MKISIPIPGEKKALKEALDKAEKKYGKLPKAEEKRIKKQVHQKSKRRATLLALAGAIGIGAGAVALPPAARAIGEAQRQNNQKSKEVWREKYRIEPLSADQTEKSNEEQTRTSLGEKQVNQLKDKDDVVNYLKELYIEQYQTQTNTDNDTLNVDDIHIYEPTYENYIYQDMNTGELITHGDYPEETRKKLDENGVIYQAIVEDTKVYKVTDKNDDIIDCVTYQDKEGKRVPVKLTIGYKYGEEQNEDVLSNMGTVVQDGWEYWKHFGEEAEKQNLIKSVDELRKNNELIYTNNNQSKEDESELWGR